MGGAGVRALLQLANFTLGVDDTLNTEVHNKPLTALEWQKMAGLAKKTSTLQIILLCVYVHCSQEPLLFEFIYPILQLAAVKRLPASRKLAYIVLTPLNPTFI